MATLTRKIGDSEFSAIGFGTMGISTYYGEVDSDEARFKILDRAYELGCTHWDTADDYGDSEEILGKWFKHTGKRNEIFLATKFAFAEDLGRRSDACYVKESAERSLKSLGVDSIDLFYLHRIPKNTAIEKTVGAMAELIKAGKIKHLGLSECSSTALRRAHAVHPIAAVQVEYSPFTLAIEDPQTVLRETARELGIKIVAYSPLGRTVLTDQDKSIVEFENGGFRKSTCMYRENFPKILAIADDLGAIGSNHGATAAQVALAWLLEQGDDIIPVPATKKLKYLEENFAAANIKLSPEEVREVRQVIAKAGLDGMSSRYPSAMLDQLFVESPPLKN